MNTITERKHAAAGKLCHCGSYHYRCADCDGDCTQNTPLGPATTATDGKTRCWKCHRIYEDRDARLRGAAPALADALADALESPTCDCPRSDLDIGGRGHLADCWTATARAALRAAGRLP